MGRSHIARCVLRSRGALSKKLIFVKVRFDWVDVPTEGDYSLRTTLIHARVSKKAATEAPNGLWHRSKACGDTAVSQVWCPIFSPVGVGWSLRLVGMLRTAVRGVSSPVALAVERLHAVPCLYIVRLPARLTACLPAPPVVERVLPRTCFHIDLHLCTRLYEVTGSKGLGGRGKGRVLRRSSARSCSRRHAQPQFLGNSKDWRIRSDQAGAGARSL